MTFDGPSILLGIAIGLVLGGALDHFVYPAIFRAVASLRGRRISLPRRRRRNGR